MNKTALKTLNKINFEKVEKMTETELREYSKQFTYKELANLRNEFDKLNKLVWQVVGNSKKASSEFEDMFELIAEMCFQRVFVD